MHLKHFVNLLLSIYTFIFEVILLEQRDSNSFTVANECKSV